MWRDLLIRVRSLIRPRRVEQELDDELRFHIERQTAVYLQHGVPAREAARRAHAEFGGLDQIKEHCRDARGTRWLEDLVRDLRFSTRLLARDRWFAAASVLALSLCIGASITVFTVVNALTRGLPVGAPDRVVRITARDAAGRPVRFSSREFEALRAAGPSFRGIAAFSQASMNIREAGRSPEPVSASYVSAAAFRLLGDRPMLGRDFSPEDDRPGAPAVVVLGARVWRSRYAADPSIVGRTVHVDEVPATVIGVMGDGFRFPMVSDLWRPLAAMTDAAQPGGPRMLEAFGRLKDDGTMAGAEAELQATAAHLAGGGPEEQGNVVVRVSPFVDSSAAHAFFAALLGAVGFLLSIGCANVAALQLARGMHRAHETGIRLVQGATRWRIARQAVVENVLLAAVAGTLGFGISRLAMDLLVRDVAGINFPYWQRWTMDGRVYVFAVLVSAGSAALCALAPALQIAGIDTNEALRERGRAASTGARVHRWSSAVLAAQLALTLVLVAGAGLMMRSYVALYRADVVVAASDVQMTRLALPGSRYATPPQWGAFYRQLEERLEAAPGIEAFALAGSVPFIGAPRRDLSVEGRPQAPGEARPSASWVPAGDGYFRTLALPLFRGRAFSPQARAEPGRAIVNRRFADLYFPGEDPIGRRIRLADADSGDPSAPWLTIVGISADVRHQQAVDLHDVDPVVHVPHDAVAGPRSWLLVRGAEDPAVMARTIREELRALDPDLPIGEIVPLERYMTYSQWGSRVFAALFAGFAWISLTLAAIGLYAVTAYAVTRRTREIGIRVAVGARTRDVVWLFARRPLAPLAVGLSAGFLGVFAVGRLLKSFLVRTSPNEPVTLVCAAGLLLAVALAACLLPAHRAARQNPVAALRYD